MISHWYDLTCPFCYLAQPANEALEAEGLGLAELPFQAHPEIPEDGLWVGPRTGPMYAGIEASASRVGLPLRWRDRIPSSRLALAAVETVRATAPGAAVDFRRALFRAHFAEDRDIGSERVVVAIGAETGVSVSAIEGAWRSGRAFASLDVIRSEALAHGVSGTPAWLVGRRLLVGLQSPEVLLATAEIQGALPTPSTG